MTKANQITASVLQLIVAAVAVLHALELIPGGASLNAILLGALGAINGTGSALKARNGNP